MCSSKLSSSELFSVLNLVNRDYVTLNIENVRYRDFLPIANQQSLTPIQAASSWTTSVLPPLVMVKWTLERVIFDCERKINIILSGLRMRILVSLTIQVKTEKFKKRKSYPENIGVHLGCKFKKFFYFLARWLNEQNYIKDRNSESSIMKLRER